MNDFWTGIPGIDSVLAETDSNNNIIATYSHGMRLGPLSQRRGGFSHFYHVEEIGSVRLLSDSSQALTDTYTFDAWGNIVASSGATVNPFLYVGKQNYYTDKESGLILLGVRYYQSQIGRFVTSDPTSLGLGDFQYSAANPIAWTDPTGRFKYRDHGKYHVIEADLSGKNEFRIFCRGSNEAPMLDSLAVSKFLMKYMGPPPPGKSRNCNAVINASFFTRPYNVIGRPYDPEFCAGGLTYGGPGLKSMGITIGASYVWVARHHTPSVGMWGAYGFDRLVWGSVRNVWAEDFHEDDWIVEKWAYRYVGGKKVKDPAARFWQTSWSLPRTMVGVSGSKVYLVVTKENASSRPQEMASEMMSLGCSDAVALDGGGSTQMAVNRRWKTTGLQPVPVHFVVFGPSGSG